MSRPFRGILCKYCGILCDALDHWKIPQSFSVQKSFMNDSEVVPCCRECNSLLTNKLIPNISERAEYLYTKYLERYKKLLNSSNWSIDELNEFSSNLKHILMNDLNRKSSLLDRLDHLKLIAGLE